MPRVLGVLYETDPRTVGGASRALLRPVSLLRRRGWEFVWWAPVPSAIADELRELGDEVHGRPHNVRFSLRELRVPPGPLRRLGDVPAYLREFDRVLRAVRPDVVHANNAQTLPEASVAHLRGVPTVIHYHESLTQSARHRAGRRALAWAADELIAVSSRTASQFDHTGRRPTVVHNGIEPGPLAPRTHADPPIVGLVGYVHPRKGSDIFVAAAERLREQGVEVDLRMAGPLSEGSLRAWSDDVIARGARAGVHWVEHVDVARELPGWDLVVVPSRYDPFPNVVLEAMSMGVPVIASDVGGIPEQLGDEGAGVLVAPESPEALANAIAELLAEPERRAAAGAAGRARVLREFSLERQADGIERVWRRVLRAR